MRTPKPPEEPEEQSRTVDRGLLFVFALIVLVVLGAGGAGVYWLIARFQVDESEVAWGSVSPEEVDLAEPPEEPIVDPLAEMRPRYRPGPYVQIVGLLPSGLSQMRRLGAVGGRTIDNPWIVAGAELHTGSPPAAESGPGLTLTGNTRQPLSLIAGAPAQLPLRASPGPGDEGAVQGLLIEFEGYPGYFFLPATVETELGRIQVAGTGDAELVFGIDSAELPGGIPAPTDKEMQAVMRVAAVDLQGRVSPWQRRELRVMPLGTGDVEVALSMSESTDLDLYVTSPSGTVIYYGNTRAGGGHLDLDANSACNGNMGVNNEHVFWPRGAAPAGQYFVRVANFSSCIGGRPVDYRITVRNCGETAVFSGRFTGTGDGANCTVDPGTRQDWCQQVVAFDVTPCTL